MLRKLSVNLAIGALGFSTSVFALDSVAHLKKLIDAGKYSEAYELATTYLDGSEGDPAFDLQYGIAAIDSGKISEGVFALERVAFLEPDDPLVRLELARGYYMLEHYDKARQLFNKVQSLDPPANVQIRINQYLELIAKKTLVPPTLIEGFVELWVGYDSNINTGPDAQTNIVTLSNNALGREDPFNQVRLGASVDHAYSPNESLSFSFNADMRYYDTEPEQDYKNLALSGGHIWKRDADRYQLNAVVQRYSLNNEAYRDLFGVNGLWSKQLSRNSVLKAFAGVNLLNYETLTWKDSTLINLGANYLYGASGPWNPIYFGGAFVGKETPKKAGVLADAEVDRSFYGGNLGAQFKPYPSLTVTPVLTYQASDYAGEDWIYKVKRKDDFAMLNINLEWALENSWALLANYSDIYADSNIELYEYDRQQAMIGLRYNFQ